MSDLRDEIKALELHAKVLEPSQKERQVLNQKVIAYADHFLDHTNENQQAFNIDFDLSGKIIEDGLGHQKESIDSILAKMESKIDYPGLNPASEGHLGYIPGGGVYASALGDYLAAVTNRYAGIYFGGPGAVKLENEIIQWMVSVMKYPKTAHGNLTSGGSIANLIAITTARDAKNIVPENIRTSVIYLTQQTHHCVHKAIRIAGLGYSIVREIPLDKNYRIDPEKFRTLLQEDKDQGLNPFLVISSAGTTDTGAMDPIDKIADLAEEYNLWHHVDAAYGGFFILLDEYQDVFKGIERSDSVVIDPHKGLFLPYGVGAVIIKDVEAMAKTHHYVAGYMQDAKKATAEISPADLSPELTKHFRGMRIWLPLQLFGLDAFKAGLQEKILLSRYFYEEIQKMGFEVGPYPDFSVVMFRRVPKDEDANAYNQKLMSAIHQDGRVFFSSTSVNGVFWMRVAILCFRTHLSTVDRCLEMIEEHA